MKKRTLGINGFGRIGKLLLWNQLLGGNFDSFAVNLGREAGKGLEDIIATLVRDSTYGNLDNFFFGHSGRKADIEILSAEERIIGIEGKQIRFLTKSRNPSEIGWSGLGVRLVADCTGKFLDPALPEDWDKGSLRGHLGKGVEAVVASAPFKMGDLAASFPEDSLMMVYGVNHLKFKPGKHRVVSAASCTTTGLSHMVKPLLETRETSGILTASMSTVHAATNTQSILDGVPKSGAKDLRKTRAVFNNIILTSTGAAGALENVLPEISRIGFMADSVRIPVNTVSMISLNVTFRTGLDASGEPVINREFLNNIYRKASLGEQKGLLVYTDTQNVSSDFAGYEAAVVVEGTETHTRTGFLDFSPAEMEDLGIPGSKGLRVPVTHAKIVGWYDNEYGCYVNCMGRLLGYMAKEIS